MRSPWILGLFGAALQLVAFAFRCDAFVGVFPTSRLRQEKRIRDSRSVDNAQFVLHDIPLPVDESHSDESLRALYKTVALQDPEWFDEFVIGLLGSVDDEIVDEELRALVQHTKAQWQKKTVSSPEIVTEVKKPTFDVNVVATEGDVVSTEGDGKNVDDGDGDSVIFVGSPSPEPVVPREHSLLADSGNETGIIVEAEEIVDNASAEIANDDDTPPPPVDTQSVTSATPNSSTPTTTHVFTEEALLGSERNVSLAKDASAPSDDRVVVYMVDGGARQQVNLTVLLRLGYREDEIASLDPTALDLIATDQIARPRTGVPRRWMMQRPDNGIIANEKLVAIVGGSTGTMRSSANAVVNPPRSDDARLEVERSSASHQGDGDIPRRSTAATSSAVPPRIEEFFDRNASPQLEVKITSDELRPTTNFPSINGNGLPTSQNADDIGAPRTRKNVDPPLNSSPETKQRRRAMTPQSELPSDRRRQSRVEDNTERPMYSGRPTKKQRAAVADDEPPPPRSGLWPDLDTFRNLLRDEAGMRLRLLGNDWKGAVKEEADWRLDLYKNWLWTLHNGVGEPFVQSRSDRARRQPQQQPPQRKRPVTTSKRRQPRER